MHIEPVTESIDPTNPTAALRSKIIAALNETLERIELDINTRFSDDVVMHLPNDADFNTVVDQVRDSLIGIIKDAAEEIKA